MIRNRTSLLMLPALAMLLFGFVVPLVVFFVKVLLVDEPAHRLVASFVRVATSEATVNAVVTTNWISLVVTATVLVIAYPIAYYLCHAGRVGFAIVVFSIVVPYFTSIIVRTYSWMVLLGRNGIINNALQATGLTDEPLKLLYTKGAIVVGMTYVLLPYMILTLFAAMKSIEPAYMRAARALGASNRYAFLRVYLPLSLHGVLSGSLIVFILAIGFFVTPALVGGPSDVMIAMLIERAAEINVDWPTAAILSLLMLAVTLALYAVYFRVTDVRRLTGH